MPARRLGRDGPEIVKRSEKRGPGTSKPPLELVTGSFPGRPAFDTAVTRAFLRRASDGAVGHRLRLYRPDAIVAFGVRDAAEEGFGEAVAAARRQGFASVLRLAGGRAAVFHEDTIAFARTIPDEDPPARTIARFQETAAIFASALASLGVDARIGEVAGEYCPGAYSVNARGSKKLIGIGQRLVPRAAHVGGVIVAAGSDRVRNVLVPVYDALGLGWEPSTAGSVAEESDVGPEGLMSAVVEAFAERFDIAEAGFDDETLALAQRLEPDHAVAG